MWLLTGNYYVWVPHTYFNSLTTKRMYKVGKAGTVCTDTKELQCSPIISKKNCEVAAKWLGLSQTVTLTTTPSATSVKGCFGTSSGITYETTTLTTAGQKALGQNDYPICFCGEYKEIDVCPPTTQQSNSKKR
eukprot:UN31327